MPVTSNQMKGNTAEYFVCYELQKNGIPVWQLGGNNKRWDIVFLSGEDDFVPAQVKSRTQNTVVFKKEDLVESKGYYFIWYIPGESNGKDKDRLIKFLETETEKLNGQKADTALLVFDSKKIVQLCKRGETRPSNYGKNAIFTNLTQDDILYGLNFRKTFIKKFSKKVSVIVDDEDE